MAHVTRRIGLSLGADICWPICYEEILKRLDLTLPVGGDTVRFEVERVTIEPFDLRQPCRYDVVVDRLTHWYTRAASGSRRRSSWTASTCSTTRGSIQSMEKHTTYCAMMRLGLPVPETWLVPPKAYEPQARPRSRRSSATRKLFDLGDDRRAARLPDVHEAVRRRRLGRRVADRRRGRRCARAYEQSGKHVMHLQKAVEPLRPVRALHRPRPADARRPLRPGAPLHDRYTMDARLRAAEDEAACCAT